MNTRIDQRSIDTAAGARRSFAPAKICDQPAVFSRKELVVYVTLLLMLFASAFVPRASAQNIYIAAQDSTTDDTSTVQVYAPDGTLMNPALVTELRSFINGLWISDGVLVVPNDTDDISKAATLEFVAQTGTQLPFSVKTPLPASAISLGGKMYVLYNYSAAQIDVWDIATGKPVATDLVPGQVLEGQQMTGRLDSIGNVHLYVTIYSSSNAPNTGSILHIMIDASGVVTTDTPVQNINLPQGIALSADGQYVYVITQDVNDFLVGYVSKYRTSGGPPIYTTSAISGYPYTLATSGGLVYVTHAGTVGEHYAATGALFNPNVLDTPLIVIGGITIGAPSCVPPPTKLVAWYSFDQGGASQKDLSAGLNTATTRNTTSIPGEVAGALQFNGKNAYVEAVSSTQNNLGTSDFSIDAWVKVASTADESAVRTIVDKRNGLPTGYHLFLYNGRIGVQVADTHDYGNFISNQVVPPDNQWHLVAVTVDRDSKTGGTWYLDGAPIGNFDPTKYPGSLNNTFPLRIGTRSITFGTSDGWFKGGIDEVEIFNRALSAGEILSIMQAGPAGKCKCTTPPSNMVAWYGFDQASSTQTDLSTTNNPATAYNTTSVIGEVAGGLQFNGTNSSVEAPSTSAVNLGTNNFSIDAWVRISRADDNSGVVVVMDKRDTAQGYHFYLYNHRIGVQLADSNGYDNYVSDVGVAVPADDQWHLIAVTVVRSSHTGGTWYLDGMPIGNFDATAHPYSLSSSSPLDIGVRSAALGGGGYFKGGIDELEIFNRALSSTEVKMLMQSGHAGKCKGY
jgi:concanavalin A-like lectin/glucanase superfamily protein